MELKNKEYYLIATEFDGIESDYIKFTQNDTNNSVLNISVPYPSDQLLLCVTKPDGNDVVDRFVASDETNTNFNMELPINLINLPGTYKATVQAYGHDDDRRTVGTFKYRIASDFNTDFIESNENYPVLTKLISDVNSLYDKVVDIDHGEGGRILAEEQRVQAEIVRKGNEVIRENQEIAREERLKEVESSLDTIVREIEGKVNVKSFKCADEQYVKGDGIHDDYTGIMEAIKYCNQHRKVLFFPKGTYLVGNTIDFDSLPYILDETNPDYQYTLSFEGENKFNTSFKGKKGLGLLFKYNATDRQRRFNFKNFKFTSEEEYDNLAKRAILKVFELFYCAGSEFENLHFIGLNYCMELKACWSSKFVSVTGERCRKGIMIDGTNLGNVFYLGWSDHCYFLKCGFGGWMNDFGVHIKGSQSTIIDEYNSESGYTGNGLIIEACRNLTVNQAYFESWSDASPILLKGRSDGINTSDDFSTGVEIKNSKFQNCSKNVHPIKLGIGLDNIKIKDNRLVSGTNFNGETNIVGFVSGGFTDTTKCYYFRNIELDGNFGLDSNCEAIKNFEGTSLCFKNNKIILNKTSNLKYWNPTFYEYDKIYPTHDFKSSYEYIEVVKSGTYGDTLTITASGNVNTNVLTVNSTTGLFPNTFITVGNQERLFVTQVITSENKVVLGSALSATITNENISYVEPILKEIPKAYLKSKSDETSLKSELASGQYYLDNTRKIPVFYDGTNFVTPFQNGGTSLTSNVEKDITFVQPYPNGRVPLVIANARTKGVTVNVLSTTNTSFKVVASGDCSIYWVSFNYTD